MTEKYPRTRHWYCDKCQERIEDAKQGSLEWVYDRDSGNNAFNIVHAPNSARKGHKRGCFMFTKSSGRMDNHLTEFVGVSGIVRLMAPLDEGFRNPDFQGSEGNIQEWLQIFRRLHLPFYEDALRYWDEAKEDGFFDDDNECWNYLPSTLKGLIIKYRKK
jgi:hypothetical protein